jgi:cathepsin D
MFCSLLPVVLLFSVFSALLRLCYAFPESSTSFPRSISLLRQPLPSRDFHEWGQWAKAQREWLNVKYADDQPQKRGTGTNLYVEAQNL